MIQPTHIFLAITAIVLAILVIASGKPFRAIILLGAFSITMATYYYALGAPDVAMAEATLGAVFTTLIYVIAIKHTGSVKVAYTHSQKAIRRVGGKLTGVAYDLITNLERRTGIRAEWTKIALGNPDTAFDFDIIILKSGEEQLLATHDYIPVRRWGDSILLVKRDDEDLINALGEVER